MRADLERRSSGSAARSTRSVPNQFVSNCSRAAYSGTSSMLPNTPMPALHTSASRAPIRSMARFTPSTTEASSRTSIETHSICGARCAASSGSREVPATRNPERASRSAAAAPMPDEAPVMSTERSLDPLIFALSLPLSGHFGPFFLIPAQNNLETLKFPHLKGSQIASFEHIMRSLYRLIWRL